MLLNNLDDYMKKYPNKRPDIIQQYGTAGFRNKYVVMKIFSINNYIINTIISTELIHYFM